tara:strand:- start:1438 stop:1719 length:282 start_codon:yes stop_codon:yes gene_type:complete
VAIMRKMYEVVEKKEGWDEKNNIRLENRSCGFYQYESDAKKYAKSQNDWLISNWMREATKLTGTVRGINRGRYNDLVEKVKNPPYTVRERTLR